MLKVNYISKLQNAIFVEQHDHKLWELVYCTRGTGITEIRGEAYSFTANELLIIPPDFKHGDTSIATFDNIHLTFTTLAISATNPLKVRDNLSKDILNILNLLHSAYHGRAKNYVSLINSLYDVLFNYIINCSSHHNDYNYTEILKNEIISNISNPDFILQDYITSLPYNPEYMRRQFVAQMKTSPTQYLIDRRMNYAKELLSIREVSLLSIRDISLLCGFSNQLYFSRLFKKHFKVSPQQYSEKQLP